MLLENPWIMRKARRGTCLGHHSPVRNDLHGSTHRAASTMRPCHGPIDGFWSVHLVVDWFMYMEVCWVIGVPPVIIHAKWWISHEINHPAIGVPPFEETPISISISIYLYYDLYLVHVCFSVQVATYSSPESQSYHGHVRKSHIIWDQRRTSRGVPLTWPWVKKKSRGFSWGGTQRIGTPASYGNKVS